MNQLRKVITENISGVLSILSPYKHQRVKDHIQLSLQDFIQLFSRLQFLQTKIQQLFRIQDNLQKQATSILKAQRCILKEKNEILNDLNHFEKQQQPPLLETFNHDISELCVEAYKNLMENQSFDLSKFSGAVQGGEWDSKLESECDKSTDFEQIKKAFQLLDRASLFEPQNLQMLMKCSENADKQIYLDFFLQIMRLQRHKTKQTKSPELREQVLQVPVCQEFSFESPLPSLRDHEQQPKFKHVNLEDLLKIQDRLITEEQSPNKNFVKKPKIESIQQQRQTEGSFYSQQNMKNLIGKDKINHILNRERTPSEHIPRSSSSPSVENQVQSTRQCFKRKISQPNSITDRTYNQL